MVLNQRNEKLEVERDTEHFFELERLLDLVRCGELVPKDGSRKEVEEAESGDTQSWCWSKLTMDLRL